MKNNFVGQFPQQMPDEATPMMVVQEEEDYSTASRATKKSKR